MNRLARLMLFSYSFYWIISQMLRRRTQILRRPMMMKSICRFCSLKISRFLKLILRFPIPIKRFLKECKKIRLSKEMRMTKWILPKDQDFYQKPKQKSSVNNVLKSSNMSSFEDRPGTQSKIRRNTINSMRSAPISCFRVSSRRLVKHPCANSQNRHFWTNLTSIQIKKYSRCLSMLRLQSTIERNA